MCYIALVECGFVTDHTPNYYRNGMYCCIYTYFIFYTPFLQWLSLADSKVLLTAYELLLPCVRVFYIFRAIFLHCFAQWPWCCLGNGETALEPPSPSRAEASYITRLLYTRIKSARLHPKSFQHINRRVHDLWYDGASQGYDVCASGSEMNLHMHMQTVQQKFTSISFIWHLVVAGQLDR